MVHKTWPALSKHKCYEASCSEEIDRLSRLPNEILLSILSSVTTKEAARSSLLSKRWLYLWRCFPNLNFEDSTALARVSKEKNLLCQEQSHFVRRVNHVMKEHVGSGIDELTVSFPLDKSFKSDIDKWVCTALEKQVKRLELDFEPARSFRNLDSDKYTLSLDSQVPMISPPKVIRTKPSLTSLCLQDVNVSTESVEWLLNSCPLLLKLRIVRSGALTSIRFSGLSLGLKDLEVVRCKSLEFIDICAPKLLSFKYLGRPVKFHFGTAPLLSEVSVGVEICGFIAFAFDSLSTYFPQLQFLSLRISLEEQSNLKPKYVPSLTKLKHLELTVYGCPDHSLLGWTPLIEACPVLQRLTLKLVVPDFSSSEPIVKHGVTLKHLEILEIFGYLGKKIDLEVAAFVIENAHMLKKIIVKLYGWKLEKVGRRRVKKLRKIAPPSIKIIASDG